MKSRLISTFALAAVVATAAAGTAGRAVRDGDDHRRHRAPGLGHRDAVEADPADGSRQRVVSKLPVRIIVMEGTCKDGTPSTPTTGEMSSTFTGADPRCSTSSGLRPGGSGFHVSRLGLCLTATC